MVIVYTYTILMNLIFVLFLTFFLAQVGKIRNLIKKNYKTLKFVFSYTLSPSQQNVNKNKNKNKNYPPFGGMCRVACACVVACGMPG